MLPKHCVSNHNRFVSFSKSIFVKNFGKNVTSLKLCRIMKLQFITVKESIQMKNKCVKLLGTLTIGVLMMTNNGFGQTPPTNVTIGAGADAKTYYHHGFNANGTNSFDETGKAVVKDGEAVDSVTVGSTMTYFVLPDPTFNATWRANFASNPANISSTTGLHSAFDWTVTPAAGSDVSSTATPIIKTINWKALGTASIKVQEMPKLSDECIGAPTVIPVQIIPKPTITFDEVNSAYSHAACYADLTGVVYPFPVTITSAVKGKTEAMVSYKVTINDGSESIVPDVPVVIGTGGVGTIDVPFTDYGEYVITITKLTDRISRKSGDAGTDLLAGGSATFTYTVMKPVQTGPVYHLPNIY